MNSVERSVDIVEVGPRDGFQPILPFIPTGAKISLIERAVAAGLRRVEIGSFVSPAAVPQLADTPLILDACRQFPGMLAQVLVPTERRGREAVAAGAQGLAYVVSVSEAHNRNNVRRHPDESAADYAKLLSVIPSDVFVRLNIATAFDCPFTGRVPQAATVALLDKIALLRRDVEICLCDTTGKADPDLVGSLFEACVARFGTGPAWAYHAHDTYGLGMAGVAAAFRQGVRVFDASFAGLGGCPFAPGATGNVATEDVVWMFDRMGVATGIDLQALLTVSNDAAILPGAIAGGRVRDAMNRRLSG